MSESEYKTRGQKERQLKKQIEVSAPISEVWKSLTDAAELVKWFAMDARVTPGVGGKIYLSWGPACEGEAEIIAWEPGKRFAWKEPFAVIEFILEARGEKTLVRLVQSGFLGNEDWENEWFESTDHGWDFMLLGLKYTLEKHRGESRQVAWPRISSAYAREETFRRLLTPGSLFANGADSLLTGRPFHLTASDSLKYSGTTEFVRVNRGVCVSIRELNDALLWITIEGPPGKIEAQMWLSAFGLPQAQLDDFYWYWQKRLKEVLA